jgi:hypothetical protein
MPATEVTRFKDPQIIESSGLVAFAETFVTTNDSGDAGRLFVVDQTSGETLRIVEWSDDPEDVEALAPGPGRSVWVGDIGDNGADREQVTVSLVDLDQRSPVQSYDLRYQGGAADAEALLRDPVTGRLLVVTKSVFGGEVMAAPLKLNKSKVNRLESIAQVSGLVTDGAFFPDGRHVILRNYTQAFVFAYLTWDAVGEFDLPDQEQGEGLAIAGPDSIFLSSEGIQSPILKMRLPADVRRAMQPPTAIPSPSPAAPATKDGAPLRQPDPEESRLQHPWELLGGVVFVTLWMVWFFKRRRRQT